MNTKKKTFIRVFLSISFMVTFSHAEQAEETHIGIHAHIGFKSEHIEHFSYEKHPEKKISLVSRLSKNGATYELLNFEGGRNYRVVKISGETREDLLDFRVYDGPNHWLADIVVTDKQIVIATVTPDTTYSVYRFVKMEGVFKRKMYALISFPPGLRPKKDELKIQSLALDESSKLTAVFDKGDPIVYSFPEGESEVHVNGRKPERSAGTIYWFNNE